MLRGLITTVAIAYVALMPFAWTPLPWNMRPIDTLVPFLGVLLLWDGAVQRTFRRLTLLDWGVLGVLVSVIPSLLVTPDPRTSTVALLKRLDIAVVFVVFAAYFNRFGVAQALSVLVRVAIAIAVVCLGAVAVYLIAGSYTPWIGQPAPVPYIGTVPRMVGGTETAEMFGNYLTFVWPLACTFAWRSVGRGRWLAGLAAIAAAMVLSFSHAVAGLAVATLVVAWARAVTPGWRSARAALAVAAALLVIAINALLIVTIRDLTWVHDRNRDVPRAETGYAFQSAEGAERVSIAVSYNPFSYFLLKKIAFDEFRQHPLTGVGLGMFHGVTERAYAAGVVPAPFRAVDPHSTVFGALAETGMLGGLAAAALFVTALLAIPRSSESAWYAWALKAGIAGIAVNGLNADVMNFRFLWIGLAALRALA